MNFSRKITSTKCPLVLNYGKRKGVLNPDVEVEAEHAGGGARYMVQAWMVPVGAKIRFWDVSISYDFPMVGTVVENKNDLDRSLQEYSKSHAQKVEKEVWAHVAELLR